MISPRTGVAAAALLALILSACGMDIPHAATAPPDSGVAAEIAAREQRGLRSDRAWVEAVATDPTSVLRDGITVSVDEAAAIDAAVLGEQVALRTGAGLRADEAWVQQVVSDPASVDRMGILVTKEEAGRIDRAILNSANVGPVLQAYGDQHADDWAGFYLNPDGRPVAQVAANLEEHRRAIADLFLGTDTVVEVRKVRWSSHQLDEFAQRFWTQNAERWFDRHGLRLQRAGGSDLTNRVMLVLLVEGAEEGVQEAVIEHFGGQGWLDITTHLDRSAGLGTGTLIVSVVDASGEPVTFGKCFLDSQIPGAIAAGAEVRDLDERGQCRWIEPKVKATAYRVEIWKRYEEGFLGTGNVVVPRGGQGQVTIRTPLTP